MSLSRLTIQNIVLIDELVIEFHNGLGVLTGETGAGKSVLLDSLGLTLGGRADSKLVRHGRDKASVVAEFDIPDTHPLHTFLADHDIEIEAGEGIILKRNLTADGRSRASVNDQVVTTKLLKQIGSYCVEIHGQFATQGLLDASTHGAMLDDYAGVGDTLLGLWGHYKEQKDKLATLKNTLGQSREEEDYLRTAIEDLDALEPQAGEEETLSQLRHQLMGREHILEALSAAHHALNGDDDPVASAQGALERVADRMNAEGLEVLESLNRAAAEIEDARARVQSVSTDLEHADQDLGSIDERLYALRAQARKHDCSVDDLADKRNDLAEQLNMIEHTEDVLAAQIKATEDAYTKYKAEALRVSDLRAKAAAGLDKKVAVELVPLKLEKARFVTNIEMLPEEQWGAHGMNKVRFLVATNPGQEPDALQKVASGGEMSRFMLALKVVMAEIGAAGTLIFDEVDAGVGGSTADAIGDRLAKLAATRQVLVVTHAPQVAARAGHHYIVEKSGSDSVTTDIRYLEATSQRQEEIARMLAGAEITAEARAAAERLLENAA